MNIGRIYVQTSDSRGKNHSSDSETVELQSLHNFVKVHLYIGLSFIHIANIWKKHLRRYLKKKKSVFIAVDTPESHGRQFTT